MFPRFFGGIVCLAFGWATASQPGYSAEAEANRVVSYTLKRFTTEHGLPQNTVRFLTQSRDGYLWIGTSAGVARYDGMRFKVYYDEFLRSGGGDTRVWDIGTDGDNRVWVRPGGALACFDHGNWSFYDSRAKPLGGVIWSSCASIHGGIWLNVSGQVKWFRNGVVAQAYPLENDSSGADASLIGEDLQGGLWMSFGGWPNKPLFRRLDPVEGTVKDLSSMANSGVGVPEMLLPSRSGALWVCGSNQFARVEPGETKRYAAPPVLRTSHITHLSEDRNGALWFICEAIPRIFQFSADSTVRVDVPDLPSKDVRCVLAGRDGVVWVGTGDQGLIQVRPRPFAALLSTNSAGEKVEVYCISTGSNARVWFATSDGLFRLQDGSLTGFTNSRPNADARIENSVHAVLEDRSGKTWVGIKREGLKLLDGDQFIAQDEANCGSSNLWTVRSLLEDTHNNLWIASELGIVKRSPDGRYEHVSVKLGVPCVPANGIKQAKDESIWFGTDGAGLYQVSGEKVKHFTNAEGLSSDYAVPLCLEQDGTAWIASPNGLNRIRNGRVATLTSKVGLLDDELYSLLDDGRGFYWSSCNRGIFRVPKAELNAVADGAASWVSSISFGEADGMPTSECNGESQPNAVVTSDGHLWFSTTRGGCSTDPGRLGLTEEPPPVVIENIFADNQLIFQDGALTAAGLRLTGRDVVGFPAGHARVLEIRYTANSFLNPKRVTFAHQLKGHDQALTDAGTERVAFYTDIGPGTYSFEVRARNEQGAWSPGIASFDFSIARHFWQTWYFYAMCILGCIGTASAIQAYRLKWQHRFLKLEEQQALANERARIARDLHDDLGTALTGLALQLDVARRKVNNPAGIADRIAEAAARARSLANRMREVVWSINPKCDTVSGLASFLEEQVDEFSEVDGLNITLNLPENIPTMPLGTRARHELALSIREAMTNMMRHSKATQVLVSLEISPTSLLLQVNDNGCGFHPKETAGHGLSNMRTRLEQVGGRFECFSQPGAGTVLRFCLPIETSGNGKPT